MSYLYRYRFVIFLFCMALLLWGVLRPETPPKLFNQSDKAMHIFAFFFFSLAARLAFCNKAIWLVWIGLIFSAPLLELLQHTVQVSRHFSWYDALGNLAGVVLALLVWQLFIRKRFNQIVANKID